MRVLFTVSSRPAHYLPMAPLGRALLRDGHDVTVLCGPSQRDFVKRAGLDPVPILSCPDVEVHSRVDYFREAQRGQWPYPWLPLHPLTGAPISRLGEFDIPWYESSVLPAMREQWHASERAAAEFARAWRPDLVVHDPMSFEGRFAARTAGVPAILSLWGPTGTHERDGVRLAPQDIADAYRCGREPVAHVLDPCPSGIEPPTNARRIRVRYVPHDPPGSPRPVPPQGRCRPRVCVTWSTALARMSGPRSFILPGIVKALSNLDIDVVVTATPAEIAALGEVPATVSVIPGRGLPHVLPHCDALVHHGGAGTTMTAVSLGVPQVAITFASEQRRNGQRIQAGGAGRHLAGHQATGEAIGTAVSDLLYTRSYREAAAELRSEVLLRPAPASVVADLEKLAAGQKEMAPAIRPVR
ncbi:MAG TPA: nucleotide disphospho-sugar-binding domain-containing protein [Candidatus Limnocylindrales bacterium]|nr:nucleotide disphospho-sugar-binding domain-containing protein [Candidatus Limnocylindrales bacterium]